MAQGTFHEAIPISFPSLTRGDPKALLQKPSPTPLFVQIVSSLIKAAFAGVWRALQSVFDSVDVCSVRRKL
jgi:hypothetical protein